MLTHDKAADTQITDDGLGAMRGLANAVIAYLILLAIVGCVYIIWRLL